MKFNSYTKPLLAVMLVSALYGCSKPAAPAAATSNPTQTTTAPTAEVSSKLGDLSAFKTIVIDTAAIVDKGDLNAAKIRIKDLETTWDSAEAGLKPRAAADWHTIDKTIDAALTALRADTPNQAACKQALADVLKAMNGV